MATFKCKRSGNTVSFNNEDDIFQMRKHEEYTEVLNERPRTERIAEEEKAGKDADEKEVLISKKRGRPKKNRL